MKIKQLSVDAATGKTTERYVEMQDVKTASEAQEADRVAAIALRRSEIVAAMNSNDVKAVRALLEGDSARIDAIKEEQAALRETLRNLA